MDQRRTAHKRSEIWQRIRAARRYGRKTQEQVAQTMGITRSAVAFWEAVQPRLRTQPTADQVMKLAILCGVSPQFLLDDNAMPDDVYNYGSVDQIRSPTAPRSEHEDDDRRTQAFWAAVRFGVIAERPAYADHFDVPVLVGSDTLNIPFTHGKTIVQFAGPARSTMSFSRQIGDLLVMERAAGHPYQKHLFRYLPQGAASGARLDRSFDISVSVFTEVGDAVQALLALS